MSLPYVTASKAEQISKEVAKEEIVNQKSKIVDIVNDAIESGDIDVGGGGESYWTRTSDDYYDIYSLGNGSSNSFNIKIAKESDHEFVICGDADDNYTDFISGLVDTETGDSYCAIQHCALSDILSIRFDPTTLFVINGHSGQPGQVVGKNSDNELAWIDPKTGTLLNMLYAGLDVDLNSNCDTLNYVKEHINDFFVQYTIAIRTDEIYFIDEEGLAIDFSKNYLFLDQLANLLQQATTDNFPLVVIDRNYNRMVMYPEDNGADVILCLNDRQYVTTLGVEFDTESESGGAQLIIGELDCTPLEYQYVLYSDQDIRNIPTEDSVRVMAMYNMLTDETLDFGEVLDGARYLSLIQAQVSHNNSFFWGMINKNFNYIKFMRATERRDHSVEEPFPLIGYNLTFRLYKDGHYYTGYAYYDLNKNKLYILENYDETDSSFSKSKKRVITFYGSDNAVKQGEDYSIGLVAQKNLSQVLSEYLAYAVQEKTPEESIVVHNYIPETEIILKDYNTSLLESHFKEQNGEYMERIIPDPDPESADPSPLREFSIKSFGPSDLGAGEDYAHIEIETDTDAEVGGAWPVLVFGNNGQGPFCSGVIRFKSFASTEE